MENISKVLEVLENTGVTFVINIWVFKVIWMIILIVCIRKPWNGFIVRVDLVIQELAVMMQLIRINVTYVLKHLRVKLKLTTHINLVHEEKANYKCDKQFKYQD